MIIIFFQVPLAADTDGYIYEQESGFNNVNTAMTAFIETGFFNGDEAGNNMFFMDKIIPDTKFESGTDIKFQLKSKDIQTELRQLKVHLL